MPTETFKQNFNIGRSKKLQYKKMSGTSKWIICVRNFGKLNDITYFVKCRTSTVVRAAKGMLLTGDTLPYLYRWIDCLVAERCTAQDQRCREDEGWPRLYLIHATRSSHLGSLQYGFWNVFHIHFTCVVMRIWKLDMARLRILNQ